MTIAISHVGICVTDLDRALRFYCDGIGFERSARFEVGSAFAGALEVDGEVQLVSQFLEKDGVRIELLEYGAPEVHGAPSSTRNQLGFTHLCLSVDDVDQVAEHLVACGGTVIASTRTSIPTGRGSNEFVFVADPDGVRVELMGSG